MEVLGERAFLMIEVPLYRVDHPVDDAFAKLSIFGMVRTKSNGGQPAPRGPSWILARTFVSSLADSNCSDETNLANR